MTAPPTDASAVTRQQQTLASERRRQDLLRLSRLGMWEWDVTTGAVLHNEAWYQMLGLEPGQGDSVDDFARLIHPEDKCAVMDSLADLLEGRAPHFHCEYRVITPGGVLWVDDSGGVSERDADGRPLKVLGCLSDITHRRLREAQLALQQRRLNDIIEATGIGTFEWNLQTNDLVVDARAASLLHTTPEALQTVDQWRARVHPQDLPIHDRVLRQHLDGELPTLECEVRLADGQGGWVWIMVRGRRVQRDARGWSVLLTGTLQDISHIKQTEAKVLETEALLRSAIDAIDEALVIFDPDDRLVFCNDRYRQIYPLVSELFEVGTPFEHIVRSWKERGGGGPAPEGIEAWVQERMRLHREGSLFVQQVEGDRYVRVLERRSPTGHIVGFRVDITELVRARQAAEDANVAKSQFLATMSHELRTPMNGILGAAQLLQQPDLAAEEQRSLVSTILRSGHGLLALLNDILDLSKVEAGRVELEQLPFMPASLLEDTRSLFAGSARDKGLSLEVAWEGPADAVYRGDPGRLRQILNNLVSNAIKFSERGQVRVRGRRSAEQAAGGAELLEFQVADQGIGISAEKQHLLFQPFSQVDASTTRRYGGTGLGLSIVKGLCERMGGNAGVRSVPGHGSTFWFTVALQPGAPEDIGRDMPAPSDTVADAPLPADARLLVVEDHPVNRLLIVNMLQHLGLQAEVVQHGQAAVDLITAGRDFDLILMDVEMPVLDGYQATAAIRAHHAQAIDARRPAIVALTANAFASDRERALSAGMDDFLAKPVMLPQLRAKLARWLVSKAGMSRPIPPSSNAAGSPSP